MITGHVVDDQQVAGMNILQAKIAALEKERDAEKATNVALQSRSLSPFLFEVRTCRFHIHGCCRLTLRAGCNMNRGRKDVWRMSVRCLKIGVCFAKILLVLLL